MTKSEIIKKFYTRESMVKILTSYVVYYQISLGNYIYETLQDIDETTNKIKELDLRLEVNTVLTIVFELINESFEEDDFVNNFESYLRSKAILHALKDFVKNDKDLLNSDRFYKIKADLISENKLFNTKMKMQYLSEYAFMFKHYDKVIDDNYPLTVQKVLLDNI
jgi:hypothetical protein